MGTNNLKDIEAKKENAFIEALFTSEIEETPDVEEQLQQNKTLVPKQCLVDTKEINAPEDIKTLYKRLLQWNKSCRDLFIDLKSVDFGATDDDMYLDFKDKNFYGKRLYFKTNPENPKDSRIIHGIKQFCKYLNIPYAFFKTNRPTLKMNIVRTWQAGLETAKPDKYQTLSRIRETDDAAVIRALLPIKHATIYNHELIRIVTEEVKVPYKLEFVFGDDSDDLILHARFLFEEEGILLGKYHVCVGFSLICSELGASPLILETFLHDKTSKTSYIASYGGDSFFKTKYDGIQPNEIKDIMPKMIERISREMPLMIKAIENCESEIDPRTEASRIVMWEGSNDAFRRAIFHEVSECSEHIKSSYDFAKHISLIAKDADSLKRLAQERIAGRYLNLFFEKN